MKCDEWVDSLNFLPHLARNIKKYLKTPPPMCHALRAIMGLS
jgi:hypothetical protein